MGRAFILQEAKKWNEAATLFARVGDLLPDDLNEGLRAKEENAWCLCHFKGPEIGIAPLQDILKTLKDQDDRSEDTARCLWRLGKCYWNLGGRYHDYDVWVALLTGLLMLVDSNREEAYRHFIASLKANPTYAPAFTSLGIYYSEFASPLDPNRASKCFQKAFELDPREAEAARRLAEGFAEDREWDLVEVVARRTIEGEGGLDAGIKGAGAAAAARYLPKNAWAWKAVGAVEFVSASPRTDVDAYDTGL